MPRDEEPASSFGSLLREYRLEAGLSQELLAERARISVDAVGALERGVRRAPQRQTLLLLVEALAVDGDRRARLEAAAVRPPQPRRRGGAPVPRAGGNVPRPLTSFVGRERELETLCGLALEQHVVTVSGPGGVGKTRLALEAALALADRFADGAWWVDLGALTAPGWIPHEIVAALGLGEPPQGDVAEHLAALLAEKHLLLVLDNCEHVVDDAARLVTLLAERCPRLAIVATSRERLRVAGEHVLPVGSLPYDGAATRLFVERAAAVDPDFRVTERSAADVATIVRSVDGLPFTIELAATKIATMGPAEIVRRLTQPFSLLVEGERTASPRHRTLRALIDWSYTLLPPEERALFRRLAVFPGSWDLDACTAVCDEPLQPGAVALLSALVGKSLVVRDRRGDEDRFRLLALVREYARERLQEEGDADDAERRRANHVRRAVRAAAEVPVARRDAAWLDAIERDYETVRAVLQWALADGHDVAAGVELTAHLGYFFDARRHREGLAWMDRALAACEHDDVPAWPAALLASVRLRPHSLEALAASQRAIEIARRRDDRACLRLALVALAQTLINLGRLEGAEHAVDEALPLFGADAPGRCRALALKAHVRLAARDTEAARRYLVDAERAACVDDRDAALVQKVFADVELASGRTSDAVVRSTRALRILEELDDVRGAAWQRSHVGLTLLADGRTGEARRTAVEALRVLAESALPIYTLSALVTASVAAARAGERDVAALGDARIAALRASLAPFKFSDLDGALLCEELRERVDRWFGADERAALAAEAARLSAVETAARLASREEEAAVPGAHARP